MILQEVEERLIANIVEQDRIWKYLYNLTEIQSKAILASQPLALHAALQDIELTMHERSRLELQRNMLIMQAAKKLEIPAESVTRDLIVENCNQTTGEELTQVAVALRSLVEEVTAIVSRNKVLLEQELEIIDVVVQGITTQANAKVTYSKSGNQGDKPRISILDATV